MKLETYQPAQNDDYKTELKTIPILQEGTSTDWFALGIRIMNNV